MGRRVGRPAGGAGPEPLGGPGRGARRLPSPRRHGPVHPQRAARVRSGGPPAPAGPLRRTQPRAVPADPGRPVDRRRLELTMTARLRVNPIACSGHGLCAELLPELITLDEWGYPVIGDQPVPARLAKEARRAVTDCPALALRLAAAHLASRSGAAPPGLRSEERATREGGASRGAAEASGKRSAMGRARRLTFRRN